MEQSQPAKKKAHSDQRPCLRETSFIFRRPREWLPDMSGPGDIGLSQSLFADGLCDPSQPGGGGSSKLSTLSICVPGE